MTETARFALPLLEPAQAQKHVTVNEALSRLDGLVQLRLASVSLAVPPAFLTEGAAYGVPAGASGAWAGHEGEIALVLNGGWVFLPAAFGDRAFVEDAGAPALCTGTGWQINAQTLSPAGAGMMMEVTEIDHVLSAGTSNTVSAAIPDGAIVFGVTGRVISQITGTLGAFRIGVSGSDNRYGSGIGLATGSWMRGMTGTPMTYYGDTDLLLTGEGGDFASGTLRLAVHFMRLAIPAAS